VVSVCILAGAVLVAEQHMVLGTSLLSVGTLWAAWHTALVAWLGRKQEK
jgi:hypothetical protein